jgi:DNA topoisomerase-3
MPILIITEKTSLARDILAALGDRVGQILPAEGHLLRLAEPHEVEALWKTWAPRASASRLATCVERS